MTFPLIEPIERVQYREDQVSGEGGLKSRIGENGWTVQSWTDPPGSHHPPHDHPYSHRVLCRTGWIEFSVEGNTYRLNPGDTLDLPREVTHEATSNPDQSTEYWLLRPSE